MGGRSGKPRGERNQHAPTGSDTDAVRAENERLRVELAAAWQRVAELDALFRSLADPVVVFDAAGVSRLANPAAIAHYGLDPVGMSCEELVRRLEVCRPDGQPWKPSELPIARALRGETVIDEPLVFRGTAGRRYQTLVSAAPLCHDGARGGAVAIWHDVTQQSRMEQALRDSEERYRQLVELSPNGIAVFRDETLLFANAAGARLVGARSPAQLIGHSIWEFVPPEYVALERERLQQLQSGLPTKPTETQLLCLNGSRVDVEISAAPIHYDGQPAVQLLVRDITERKQAEAVVAQQQRVLDVISDNILAHVAYLDRDFRFVRVNATYARGSGYTPEELIGRNHFDLFPNEENRRIFERVRDTCEPYVARAKQFSYAEQPERGATYWNWWLTPICLPDGTVEGLVLSLVDVTDTECARLEVERLNEELREANSAKDRFIAVLSHELRNPLSPILAGVQVLRRILPSEPRVERTLRIIEHNTKLQARLVDDLLDLSRLVRGRVSLFQTPLALDEVVETSVEAAEDEIEKAGIQLTCKYERGLWVLGDAARLQQVVGNLLSNAVKFTPPGGEVRVEVSACARVGDDRPPKIPTADSVARYGCIVVEDTGVGIEPALLPRLFDIFQQGEVEGQRAAGLGIGLALVKSLVELHGGQVWAESEGRNRGSRFTVALPLTTVPYAEPEERETSEAARASLLLVEDNEDTRLLLADSLELLGYRVSTAASAEEALTLLQTSPPPDAILADIGLPGIDGYELMRRVRRLPGLEAVPALAITGWGQDEDVRRAREAGFSEHLTKPVDVNVLDKCLRALLR